MWGTWKVQVLFTDVYLYLCLYLYWGGLGTALPRYTCPKPVPNLGVEKVLPTLLLQTHLSYTCTYTGGGLGTKALILGLRGLREGVPGRGALAYVPASIPIPVLGCPYTGGLGTVWFGLHVGYLEGTATFYRRIPIPMPVPILGWFRYCAAQIHLSKTCT